MKKAVYLDSTVLSYLYDERESIKLHCDITRKWWQEESKNFDIFISLETIAELNRGNYPKKKDILDFVEKLEKLEPNPEISLKFTFKTLLCLRMKWAMRYI